MMEGIHFYSDLQMIRSTCGWITSRFTHTSISNAEHHCFLSILQSFATFWWPGFKTDYAATLHNEHPSKPSCL